MLVYRRTKKLSREPIVPCLDLRERRVTCKETSMLEFMTPANLRFQKALHVMKKIGFPEQKSKPVLEKLLELYEKNWEHIEHENYRVLADAILDSEEIEASELKKQHENTKPGEDLERKIEVENELERPSKKLRLRSRESRSLPIIEPIEICKVNKIPLDSDSECEEIESYSTSGRNSGKQHVSQNSSALRDRVYSPLPRKVSTKKRYFEGLSHQEVLKDPKVEQALNLRSKDKLACTSALLNSKDEPFVEKTRQPKVPIIVIDPEPLGGGNSASDRQLPTVPSLPTENLEITSSISGNVKVYFTCNSDPALALPNFHMPNRNTILKSLNNKFRRSYKISNPDFCVAKLVKDVSDCILELGTGSKTDTQSSSLQNTPSTPSNGSVNIQSNADMSDHVDSDGQNIQQWSHDPNDISRGQEKVAIPLIKGINNESPPSFHYIANNAVLQNAYINFSLARIGDQNCCSSCSGNCLLSPNPCPCLYETGGEFAYTVEGLVKEDFLDECVSMNRYPEKHCHFYCQECPLERSKNEAVLESCKGHLMRRFIKECWVKCGCNIRCGNRVVQRGISRQLEVFMTRSGKGWGLRTLEELPKGAFVCEYVGEVLTNAELDDRISKSEKKEKHTYPVLLDADWGAEGVLKDEEALCLDATFYGNVARFINHRCYDSNLVEIPVEIETPDHHYYHLAFFTTRKVAALEELTWDYGIDFDDHKHPVKAFSCQCGSRHCRKRKKAKPRTKIRGIGI